MTLFNRLRDYPHILEVAYQFTERVMRGLYPLFQKIGYERADKLMCVPEEIGKGAVFNCKMCGQCVLHFTGMTCPMSCPKNLRNGPCGGVRVGGFCEVDATMKCVWVKAFERSKKMHIYGNDFFMLLPPLNQQNMGRSAFINIAFLKNAEMPKAWKMETGLRTNGRLETALRSGKFVVTAEISPPDSADPQDVLMAAQTLGRYADALNVTDGSGANCHISSVAACAILSREGYEVIFQMSCRDRNRIAMQGELLGASALGLHNVLCLTGDDVTAGDHPQAKRVFDIDSMQLIQTARIMRDDGIFLSGRKLSAKPNFFLGGADNPFVEPFEFRPLRLAKKIQAGAEFFQSQYCFDVERLKSHMQKVRDLGLHEKAFIIIGVGPLRSEKTAEFLRTKVPGVYLPDSIVERMHKTPTEKKREEGKKICAEIIQQVREIQGVAGIHMMAYKQEEAGAEILEEVGLTAIK